MPSIDGVGGTAGIGGTGTTGAYGGVAGRGGVAGGGGLSGGAGIQTDVFGLNNLTPNPNSLLLDNTTQTQQNPMLVGMLMAFSLLASLFGGGQQQPTIASNLGGLNTFNTGLGLGGSTVPFGGANVGGNAAIGGTAGTGGTAY